MDIFAIGWVLMNRTDFNFSGYTENLFLIFAHLSYISIRAAMPDSQKKLVKFRLIPMDKKEEYKTIDPADIKKVLI